MTVLEMRKAFLDYIRSLVNYWHSLPGKTDRERLEGLAFSILVVIDGEAQLPAFDLIPRPHSSDEAFRKGKGEDWWVPEPLNPPTMPMLHDEFSRPK